MRNNFKSSIEDLRQQVSDILSEKRMKHVLAVEDMAKRLGMLYFPDDDESLWAINSAALLHDVTKELSDEQQLALLESYSVKPLPEELQSMPTIHALTASLLIRDKFPEFDDERIVSSVKYHTTGRKGMSIYEKIVFLADYIEDTRVYPDCISVRSFFWDAEPTEMDRSLRIKHLDLAVLSCIEKTLSHLVRNGKSIHPATVEARDWLAGEEA